MKVQLVWEEEMMESLQQVVGEYMQTADFADWDWQSLVQAF